MLQLPPPLTLVIFAYSDNGAGAVEAIAAAGLKPKLVVTVNRSHESIVQICHHYKFPLEILSQRPDIDLTEKITQLKPDLICVASFPYLFSPELINLPQFGTLNVHTSALPRLRGYHPLNWAFILDEAYVGVSLHYLDQGMDTGDIISQKLFPLKNSDTINTIKRRLNHAGSKLLVSAVLKISSTRHKLTGTPQNHAQATFAPRRYPSDSAINWQSNTRDIFNLIRASLEPYPNAFSYLDNEKVEFHKHYVPLKPGQVIGKVSGFYVITTSDGVILVKTKSKLKLGDTFNPHVSQ